VIVRLAVVADVHPLVDVQQQGAVLGLSHIFPQGAHPFPREDIARRWIAEIADPAIQAYVSTDDQGTIIGFAATRGGELLHFGTAPRTWGSGLAADLHDAVLGTFAQTASGTRVRLRVFEANLRARRFYEKLGWRQTGVGTATSFPPHPRLLEYDRRLDNGRHADDNMT